MPLIPIEAIVAALAVAFVAAMIYFGVRFMRESREEKEKRAAARAEVGRRAAAKGRRIENGVGHVLWTQHGTTPNGEAWTLAYCVGYHERMMQDVGRPIVVERDMITGQHLEWRCPAVKHAKLAFSFYKRTDDKKKPEEVSFDPDDELWRRWRLEARDEAIARRAFSPAVCALLTKLPLGIAWNTYIDERTSITLGSDGLLAVLGLDDVTPDLVDLWIDVNEGLAAGIKV